MACSGKCKLARIWNGIFAALDDQDAALIDIAWMPAHTAVTDVGVSTLSDGRTLTAHDRRGNEEADRLAKKRLPSTASQNTSGGAWASRWRLRSSWAGGSGRQQPLLATSPLQMARYGETRDLRTAGCGSRA